MSRGTPPVSMSQRGDTDVMAGTTVGGRLDAQPNAPNRLRGTLKPTAKGTCTAPVSPASIEAASRRTSPGEQGEVPEQLSVASNGTTSNTSQVDEVVFPGERRNKTPCIRAWGEKHEQISGMDSREVRKQASWPRRK